RSLPRSRLRELRSSPFPSKLGIGPSIIGWLLGAVACSGSIGGPVETTTQAPPPPPVEPTVVTDAQALDLQVACLPLVPGETLASVSPDGHAWLTHPSAEGEAVMVRVVDPATFEPSDHLIELPPVGQVNAWSARDASLLAGGS
ncbi:MAG: hypothetical protein AAGA56_08470, partial [Myxococcota bacterium]